MPRYRHLEGNNPWVRARELAEARTASAEYVDGLVDGPSTGEIPAVGRRDAGPADGTADGPRVEESSRSSRSGAFLVGAGILLSRFAGLAREIAIANYLAVGAAADAFKAALRIPNLLQNLLGEGVLSASFIPVYARLLDEDEEEAGRVAGAVAGALVVVAGLAAVLGVVFAEPITEVLTPGFEGAQLDLTVRLVRIMFPGVAVLVLSAWCLGVLNSHRRFFLSYVAPVLWNAAQIAAIVTLGVRGSTDEDLAVGLAWGVVAGGALQLAVQLPAIGQVGRGIRVSVDVGRAAVREVGRRFGPVLLGRGVVQLVGYVDLLLASLLAVGAVSAFTYAQVLYLLPISLFGMSVAAAELPELSRLAARPEAVEAVRARLEDGLGRIAFFVAPIQAVYLAAGGVIAAALLQWGEFSESDANLVWLILAGSSLALLATTASRLLQNALYALGDSRTPAIVAALRVGVAAGLGAVLMFQLDRVVLEPGETVSVSVDGDLPASFEPLPDEIRFDEAAPLRLGAVGLAVGSAVGAWLELALLRRAVRARVGPVRVGGARRAAVVGSAGAAGVVALGLRWGVAGSLTPRPTAVVVLLPAGLVYLGLTLAQRVPEARRLARRGSA